MLASPGAGLRNVLGSWCRYDFRASVGGVGNQFSATTEPSRKIPAFLNKYPNRSHLLI